MEGVRTSGATIGWQAGRVYSFRVVNTVPGHLASVGLHVATPNHALLNLAVYDEYYEEGFGSFPQTRLFHSGEVTITDTQAEWIVPLAERPLLTGEGLGYWVLFTLSEMTQVMVAEGVHSFWVSPATPFGAIDEFRFEDEFHENEAGLAAPSIFMTVVPEE